MVYDPTEGPIGLKNGDRVRVHGRIDKADLFEKGEIDANYIVILSRISKASK
jgi:ATP-dependent helicase/DNAse subunit B